VPEGDVARTESTQGGTAPHAYDIALNGTGDLRDDQRAKDRLGWCAGRSQGLISCAAGLARCRAAQAAGSGEWRLEPSKYVITMAGA